jgi:hypothetical protein
MALPGTYVKAAPTNPWLRGLRAIQTRVALRAHEGLEDIRREARTPTTAFDDAMQTMTGVSPHSLRALAGGAKVLFSPVGGTAEAGYRGAFSNAYGGRGLNEDDPQAKGFGDMAEMLTPLPGKPAEAGINALLRVARRTAPRVVEQAAVPASRIAAAVEDHSDHFLDAPPIDTVAHEADIARQAETMPIPTRRGTLTVSPLDSEGVHHNISFDANDGSRVNGLLSVTDGGKRGVVSVDFGGVNPNSLGAGTVRDLGSAIRRRFPDLEQVEGVRVSGARAPVRRGFAEDLEPGAHPAFMTQTLPMDRFKLPEGQRDPSYWPAYEGQDPVGDGFIERAIPTTPIAANQP